MTRNKKFLVTRVMKSTGQTRATVNAVVKEFIRELNRSLLRDEKIILKGWGTWDIVRMRASCYSEFGKRLNVRPPSKRIRFRMGIGIRRALNADNIA